MHGKRDLVDTSGRKLEGKVREKREYIKKTPGQLKILMKEFRRYIGIFFTQLCFYSNLRREAR